MTELIQQPSAAALANASRPNQSENFTHVTGENDVSFWLRVAVDWGDGSADSITENLCPVNEAHMQFSEILDEHIERLKRALRHRRHLPASSTPKPQEKL